jgi:hypothetical protein
VVWPHPQRNAVVARWLPALARGVAAPRWHAPIVTVTSGGKMQLPVLADHLEAACDGGGRRVGRPGKGGTTDDYKELYARSLRGGEVN